MPPSLRIGLELPPLRRNAPGIGRRASLSVTDVATRAEHAKVGTLWLASARTGGIDPGPLAGAVAASSSVIGVGIVNRPSWGRHPSVLARDVTTVDLLSQGRAAVAVIDEGASTEELERLAEATALLHRLFTEHVVTMAGRFYEVGELTTRPRPLRPEGLSVVSGFAGPPPTGDAPVEVVVAAGADALVIGGAPADIAASRRRLDALGPGLTLIWRGALPEQPKGAALLLEQAIAVGADGVIAVLSDSAASNGGVATAEVESVLEALVHVAGHLGT